VHRHRRNGSVPSHTKMLLFRQVPQKELRSHRAFDRSWHSGQASGRAATARIRLPPPRKSAGHAGAAVKGSRNRRTVRMWCLSSTGGSNAAAWLGSRPPRKRWASALSHSSTFPAAVRDLAAAARARCMFSECGWRPARLGIAAAELTGRAGSHWIVDSHRQAPCHSRSCEVHVEPCTDVCGLSPPHSCWELHKTQKGLFRTIDGRCHTAAKLAQEDMQSEASRRAASTTISRDASSPSGTASESERACANAIRRTVRANFSPRAVDGKMGNPIVRFSAGRTDKLQNFAPASTNVALARVSVGYLPDSRVLALPRASVTEGASDGKEGGILAARVGCGFTCERDSWRSALCSRARRSSIASARVVTIRPATRTGFRWRSELAE